MVMTPRSVLLESITGPARAHCECDAAQWHVASIVMTPHSVLLNLTTGPARAHCECDAAQWHDAAGPVSGRGGV